MSDKGILYVMTTAVDGLIKIGQTNTDGFERRMYMLEHNGYNNINVLKRVFAIEVEDYIEKEKLLHMIFGKSRVGDSELFAVDVNVVVSLLSSFEGEIVYPKNESKQDVFSDAVTSQVQDGTYYFKRKKRSENKVLKATAKVVNGSWVILKGSIIATTNNKELSDVIVELRKKAEVDANGCLLKDFKIGKFLPTRAAIFVIGGAINGWDSWKNADGVSLDKLYRSKE